MKKVLRVCMALVFMNQWCNSFVYHCPPPRSLFHNAVHFFSDIVSDAIHINMNVFSLDTIKIITGITPFYLATRMIDEKAQSCFYDPYHHRNIHQLPHACHTVAKYGVGLPMVLLSSLAIFGWDQDIRITARMFAIGLPFVQSGKDVIKKLRLNACLRPWHQDFDCHHRSSGGFPSGHIANVSYAATLFGLRYGPRWAVPLSLFGAFVFADFFNCNRHYLSQLVAGVGLGVIFAVAANKRIEEVLDSPWRIGFACDDTYTGIQVSYSY